MAANNPEAAIMTHHLTGHDNGADRDLIPPHGHKRKMHVPATIGFRSASLLGPRLSGSH